jgi:prephenate dehydrogenase
MRIKCGAVMKKDLKDMVYGFVGLGLMGGSLAKAVRENVLSVADASGRIFACDKNRTVLDLAKKGGIIDEGFSAETADDMISACDFVYVCLYPHATLDFLTNHGSFFKKGAIVTDISGVKAGIVDGLSETLHDYADFIPGHPMAGSEKEGYIHSSGAVFSGRNYILLPQRTTNPENLVLFKELITAIGFTRIIETDAETHDHKIAFTSQLCHIIASALVDSAEDEKITEFGGGSFEDLTRIAMINAPLWSELFLANKKELLDHIESFEEALDDLKELIRWNDGKGLTKKLENVRKKRMAMSCIDTSA